MSISRPLDVIHVMNAPRPSPFFASSVLFMNMSGQDLGTRLSLVYIRANVSVKYVLVCLQPYTIKGAFKYFLKIAID